MDEILTKLALHTATFVGKAAFAYSTNYAMNQVTKYIKRDASNAQSVDMEELERVKATLEATIRMVQPAIDLIEIISARGNTALEPTAVQTTLLRKEIESFARSLSEYNLSETESTSSTDKKRFFNASKVTNEMQTLIQKIEKFVPYLNLMMTTSGANLGWSLPNSTSPSRLLQASDALREANRLFSKSSKQIRVGPGYKLKLYYMFTASVRPKSVNDFTWKEEFSKCDAALYRVHDVKENEEREYIYELIIVEDLNDGRYHEEFDNDGPAIQLAEEAKLGQQSQSIPGKIKRIPVGEISRLYYTSSGSLLNIEDSKSPVLVLKVIKGLSKAHLLKAHDETTRNIDLDANPLYVPPNTSEKRAKESKEHSNSDFDNDDQEESAITQSSQSIPGTPLPRKIPLSTSHASPTPRRIPLPKSPVSLTPRRIPLPTSPLNSTPDNSGDNEIHQSNLKTLSLLEYMLRLSALEVCEQTNHLEIADEKINLFLKDDDSTGSSASTVSASTPESSPSKVTPRRSMPKSISSSRKLLFKDEIDSINKMSVLSVNDK
ncbi:13417_t:CDS:2 [Cetraspora pellucida]|uniref:13417_t:CDS:1 n=1 Tax=Cetraspora pellucida TaxID=1433469 RepID=A0A9N9INA5_9GLOM|nr:13417_t:CDS:2 [Cetraspora pellucida]